MIDSLLTKLSADAAKTLVSLKDNVHKAESIADIAAKSTYYRTDVIPLMEKLRKAADEMEVNTADKYWPFPTYGAILYQN